MRKNQPLQQQTGSKVRNNTLQNQKRSLRYLTIEVNTQKSILYDDLKSIHPNRNHQQDLKWMNTYGGKFKEKKS
jgi:hypothetical protein